MARDDLGLVGPGSGWYNGDWIDPNNLGGVNIEGKIVRFEALAPLNPATDPTNYYQEVGTTDRTGRYCDAIVMRNRSGIYLKPGRLIRFASPASYPYGTATDGYATGAANEPIAGAVDPYWSSNGVPPLELFLCVFSGPTMLSTASTGTVAINPGAILVPLLNSDANPQTDDAGGRVTVLPANPAAADYEAKVAFADITAEVTADNTLFSVYIKTRWF